MTRDGRWRVLEAVRELLALRDIPPTLREVATRARLPVSVVHHHVKRLCGDGLLERDPGSARSLRLPGGSQGPVVLPLTTPADYRETIALLHARGFTVTAASGVLDALLDAGLVVCRLVDPE